jgi:hypothetical protein
MKSRKLLLSLAVFFLVGAFASAKASPIAIAEGEEVTDSTLTGWHQIGPNNVAGRVRTIMFDKFNDGVIYACSPTGGLFISVNDGNNWQAVSLGEGANSSYVATSIAQDDNGIIYVGTGEGSYSEAEAGKKHFKTGLLGNGVYKSSEFDKNWAANLQTDEEKYQFVAENISFTQMEGTVPDKYDIGGEWIYINDMAFVGGKLFVATKNAGLKVYSNGSWETATINNNTMVNVTDIKVSANGKVVVAYVLDNDAAVAIANDIETSNTFTNSLTKDKIGLSQDDIIVKIELSFSLTTDKLYALVNYYKATGNGYYSNEAIYRQVENSWEAATSGSLYIGTSEGMSIAINDRDEEFIYAGGSSVVSGFDANNDPIFYYNTIASSGAERNSGNFVPAGIHAIAFDPNPQTTEDSIKVYLATDAGVYIYKQDPLTQFVQWHACNKGLISAQYYNVASTNDGAVFGAAESNAISYIPTPGAELKSAETIWSPNSTGYSAIANQIDPYAVPTGSNVLASAIHQSLPTVKKPVVLARPYMAMTRTYSDNNDYESINDQTWNYGAGTELSFLHPNTITSVEKSSYIAPIALWESFNAPEASQNTVYLVLNDKLTIRRNGTNYMYSHGFELKDGDSAIVQSTNLGYPFFFVFSAERFGTITSDYTGEEVLNLMTTQDTSIEVSNPVRSRLFIAAANGLYVCNEPMNFTKTYQTNNPNSLPWVKLFNFTSAEEGKRQIREIAPSEDGNTVLISIDIQATNNAPASTKLYRISGLNQHDLSAVNRGGESFGGTPNDVNKFTTVEIASFDRSISSIAYANNDVAIITLQGYTPINANIYRATNLTAENAEDVVLTPITLENDAKPVYSALVEKVSTEGTTVYVGTDDGVYKTTDYTAANVSWTKEEAFPAVPVYDLFQQTANLPSIQFTTYIATNAQNNVYNETKYPGAIYAATYGKGLFMNYDNITEERPEPVSLNSVEQTATTNVDLYPNPAQNQTTLSYTLSSSSNVTLNIFDMNGRLISSLEKGRQAAGLHTQEISLSGLEKGVYMIQIITNQTSEAAKLIVQ